MALALCATAGAQQPIKKGDTLTGKLRLVATRHPNGTKLEACIDTNGPKL